MTDPRPPAEDLSTALARIVAPDPSAPEGVATAVAMYAAAVAGPDDAVRAYRPRQVAVLLGVWAAVLLTFDSEGLMTWVQRMELGPVQTGWRAALGPLNTVLIQSGLTSPRRWLVGAGDRLGRALGAGEDPLLAEGWSTQESADVPIVSDEPIEAAPVPLVPIEPSAQLAPLTRAGPAPVGVLLVGDSMIAGSLGASISRGLGRDHRLRVVQAFQTATGLSRPDVYDWMKVLPALIEREHPRLIVCSLGANDSTAIRDSDRQLEFGEAGWRAAYSARVVEMMRRSTSGGAQVLWLGLPPMRSGKFSAHAQYLNAIFAQSARKVPGVEFLELRMLVSDDAGEYATFVRGPNGALVRFRLDDGVHYSPAGARAIARWVVDWIYERYRKLPQ